MPNLGRNVPKVKPDDELLFNLRTAAKEITEEVIYTLLTTEGKETVAVM
jgi:hypothetical protein